MFKWNLRGREFPATSPTVPSTTTPHNPTTTVPPKPSFPPGWDKSYTKSSEVQREEAALRERSWYPGVGGKGAEVTSDSFSNWWKAKGLKARVAPISARPCVPMETNFSSWGAYRMEKRKREEEGRERRRIEVKKREGRRRGKEAARVEKEWVRSGEDVTTSSTPTASPGAARKYRWAA